jgi:PKD repeat protein
VTDYTATIAWGDGSTSTGTVSARAGGGWQVSGNHTYADDGSYTATVTVNDVGGSSASVTSTVAVNDAALGASGTPIAPASGQAFSRTVASFWDSDVNGTVSDYTASINWGDGTTSAGSVTASGTNFDVRGGHTYSARGIYTVTVTVDDAGGASATATAVADVTELSATGATVSATEGSTLTAVLATFTNYGAASSQPSDYTAAITWGDGTTSSGIITPGVGGSFDVSGSHAYADEGGQNAQVSITWLVHGVSTTAGAQVQVGDAALSATSQSFSAAEGGSFNGVLATFTDGNAGAAVSDYTATITWGDGSAGLGSVSARAGGGWQVSGTHIYAEEGAYTASVSVQDEGGQRTSTTSVATVTDAPLSASGRSVQATEGNSFSGVVADFTDSDRGGQIGDYTARINWGDGTVTTGTIVAAGPAGFNVRGAHAYAQPGAYDLAITVRDAGGSRVSALTTALINDAPLVQIGVQNTVWTSVDTPVTGVAVGQFVDRAPGAVAGQFSVTIAWGDGTTGSGSVVQLPNGAFEILGNHTYANPGPYPVQATVRDVTSTLTIMGDLTVNVLLPVPVSDPGMPQPSHPTPPGKVLVVTPATRGTPPPGSYALPPVLAADTAPEAIAHVIDKVFEYGGAGMREPVGRPGGQDPDGPADTTVAGDAEWEVLAAQAKTPDDFDLDQAVDQVFAAGISILASIGFILWNSQYGYLLFSALTARPLWKEFDPLAVINFWEKEAQKRKQPSHPLLDDEEEEQALEPLFG